MQNKITKLFFIYLSVLCSLQTVGQELPPIQNFTTENYNAQNQNWSISQADDKYIYIANNAGLLEYNGAKWQLYQSPNQTVLRSVEVIGNRIYTGCYMEFGYWERDNLGILEYTSLSQKLNVDLIEDEQFWNIIALDDWVLFQSLNRIYIVNVIDLSVNTIDSETELTKMTVEDETVYFQKKGVGLFKIINGKSVLVSDDSILRTNSIVNVSRLKDKLLIQTEDNGFFVLETKGLKQWEIPANDVLLETSVFSSLMLNDGSFVFGTISHGLIFMTSEGEISYTINQNNGLINNTVLSVFQDLDQDIWLGLDNGISFINITSPYRIFKDDSGKLGTVYTSLAFKGFLYLGTNQGLFYKRKNNSEEFQYVEGTNGQVWSLEAIDGKIFCGHNKGTMIIDDNMIINIITDAIGSWGFKRVPNKPNLVLQGNFNGLNILENSNGNWTFRNKIDGIDISSRFFTFSNDRIYVNHELKGLYELEVGDDYRNVKITNRIDHINYGVGSNVFNYNDNIIYTSSEGVFKQNQNREFKLDSAFTSLFTPYNDLSTMMKLNGDKEMFWRFVDDNIMLISSGAISDKPNTTIYPVSSIIRDVVTGFENVTKISDSEYLVGRSNGFLLINENIAIPNKNFSVSINRLEVNEIDQPKQKLDPTLKATFSNRENNISFAYSFVNYGEIIENKYQYQLLGLSDNWSNWTEESSHTFQNLPFGTYTFNVRGKAGNVLTKNIASYSFTIKRPLLLSNLAIGLYILITILLLFAIHYYYRRYYRSQQQKVIEKTKRELELKELENSKELMTVRNEKLRQDIDHKNRELAISTMSLIKKNEFLSNIKEDLKNAESSKGLNSVIKVIDKNLNNTDDWKFFEEAFNNADKDFLKKVKSKHPSLTPNDLKLCAYLRLNLTSKEIAPLLNISPKSVEVKRYRLRKKMELSHEDSLTNYILEI
ncbi:triple tyrosine motif-containing protein [Psychroserpens sp. Hel_I_66]|uniref:helix-turn-helix and ligand-binding sensor domain-containing protein n=1 Tax=Psychroserpens sp. Hel_I_66 TaxID=1250004 RepID=UPI0006485EE5|nr:triple tyrosine motif-containing protein [Psychroserpens sp. Hel_I_66]